MNGSGHTAALVVPEVTNSCGCSGCFTAQNCMLENFGAGMLMLY